MKTVESAPARHTLALEERNRLTATGISDVEGFDDETIQAVTPLGILTVRGKALKVERFSADTGELAVTGEVSALAYSADTPRRAGIMARIFR